MTQLRMLVCFAHPDDEAFSAAGFLSWSTSYGVSVRLICATRGEEGDIRYPGSAERETLGEVRQKELEQSCQVLGIQPPVVLDYRDSGWADSPAEDDPRALVNAAPEAVVGRLVEEIRRFRPQMLATFEPEGLSGHKDHVAISKHTTIAFHAAGKADAYPEHLDSGLAPYRPTRLFYLARPRGFRLERALILRRAGIDTPLPPPELRNQGVPPEEIDLTLDVSARLDLKLASIKCHRTQLTSDWPFPHLPTDVVNVLLGQEYLIQAHPVGGVRGHDLSSLFGEIEADDQPA